MIQPAVTEDISSNELEESDGDDSDGNACSAIPRLLDQNFRLYFRSSR